MSAVSPVLASPAAFAHYASGGRWQMARHLRLVNLAILGLLNRQYQKLMIWMPVRHGKSYLCSHHLPAYYLGLYPDRRFLLSAYESSFAAEWGAAARDIFRDHGRDLFGLKLKSTAASNWKIAGHEGGMRTAGWNAGLTGRGGHFMGIDDPVKNAEEALSEHQREKLWNTYLSTYKTRASQDALWLAIGTRWHDDDLLGRILKEERGQWALLVLRAIAEDDDPLGREPGEALWPEVWPIEHLQRLREESPTWFSALYQQRPISHLGAMFPRGCFDIVGPEAVPPKAERLRMWDLAATDPKKKIDPTQAETAGVRAAYFDGEMWIEDVVWAMATPAAVDRLVRQTADLDGPWIPQHFEREPGSGGKRQVDHFARKVLPDREVRAFKPEGDKVVRAHSTSSAASGGRIHLVRGAWNKKLIDQAVAFPTGKKDVVDAMVAAYLTLTRATSGFILRP